MSKEKNEAAVIQMVERYINHTDDFEYGGLYNLLNIVIGVLEKNEQSLRNDRPELADNHAKAIKVLEDTVEKVDLEYSK